MMSSQTMTGAVNLSSSRNSRLTTMAMTRPLRGGKEVGGRGGSTFVKAKDPFRTFFTPTKIEYLNAVESFEQ